MATALKHQARDRAGPFTDYIRVDEDRARFEIDKRVFNDPEIFARERELIFSRCWLYAFHESELDQPNAFVSRQIAGRNLLFTRARDGKVRGFYNYCTHRGTRLAMEEKGCARVFTCPYHGWVFGNAGNLKGQGVTKGGYRDDFNDDGRYDLAPVERLDQYRGWYFVNFNPRAAALSDYLGGSREYLDLMADQSADGLEVIGGSQHLVNGGNWKIIPDNLVDVYHGDALHSTYFDFVISRTGNKDSFVKYDGIGGGLDRGHSFWESGFAIGRPIAQWIPAFGEEMKPVIEAKKQEMIARFGQERGERIAGTNRNMIIFPNLSIVDNLSISMRVSFPIGPDRLQMDVYAMAPKGEEEALRKVRLANHLTFTGPGGFAHPDDYETFERVREGNAHSPQAWHDYSKGMGEEEFVVEGDRRTARSHFYNESQQRAWWTQWDRIIAGAETLED